MNQTINVSKTCNNFVVLLLRNTLIKNYRYELKDAIVFCAKHTHNKGKLSDQMRTILRIFSSVSD